jgi:hypothetical protein
MRDKIKEFKEKKEKEVDKKKIKKNIEKDLKKAYQLIVEVLKDYCDMEEKYYGIVALWIMGTYFHDEFEAFPYLYFNAMKGSGKTRILRLISHLAHNAIMLGSLTEAVLFRLASQHSFCLDEIERIASKEKSALRELLNSAYKKGLIVSRLHSVKKEGKETQEPEKFNVYTPVAMANIYGLNDILQDRCLTIILEKSSNPRITKLIEIFEYDEKIAKIKNNMSQFTHKCDISDMCDIKKSIDIMKAWNQHIRSKYNVTHVTHVKHVTNVTHVTPINPLFLKFFDKIDKVEFDNRYLELFFPLFFLAIRVGVLDETITTAKEMIKEKKEEDRTESKDISLIEFVSQRQETSEFEPIKTLLEDFKLFIEDNSEWLNSRWIGKRLRILKLVRDSRHLRNQRQVQLDYQKAKKKIKQYKDIEDSEDKTSEKS